MSDWAEWIGRSERRFDVLTQGVIDRLRATTDSADHGPVAPQGIHWCLCLPDAPTAQLGADGHPVRGGFLPPIALPRRMWASSTVEFLRPLRAGDTIERMSTIRDIAHKSGNSGELIFVTLDHMTLANGTAAVRETQTIVYRAAANGGLPPAPPSNAATALPSGVMAQRIVIPQSPQLLRYSALTFNAHRIHYDLPYARDAEGYRGLVVHGPLTATLLLDCAARVVGGNQLRQFAFRGLVPAFAGEEMALSATRDGDALILLAVGPDGIAMRAQANA